MLKKRYLVLLLTLALLLCACTGKQDTKPPETVPAVTQPPETAPSTTAPTQPPHSALYLPDCRVQKIKEYFAEVVLDVEYSDGPGDVTLVQKWITPLYYQYYGQPTETDKEILEAFFAQLNAVPGFPGIYAAEDAGQENLSISFLDADAFSESFSDVIGGEDAFGAAQFWYYTDTNDLYTARIGYRTDIDQLTRNSILLEEIVNTLGITDTILRPDSIVYQYSNEALALSDVDWVIVKLLYDPTIRCGMDAADCAAIIEKLYY